MLRSVLLFLLLLLLLLLLPLRKEAAYWLRYCCCARVRSGGIEGNSRYGEDKEVGGYTPASLEYSTSGDSIASDALSASDGSASMALYAIPAAAAAASSSALKLKLKLKSRSCSVRTFISFSL